jgi:hypothetical protein
LLSSQFKPTNGTPKVRMANMQSLVTFFAAHWTISGF